MGTTFWSVQGTQSPQSCSHPWLVAFTMSKKDWMLSKGMYWTCSQSEAGTAREPQESFSPSYPWQTVGSACNTLKPLSLPHFAHLGKEKSPDNRGGNEQ